MQTKALSRPASRVQDNKKPQPTLLSQKIQKKKNATQAGIGTKSQKLKEIQKRRIMLPTEVKV